MNLLLVVINLIVFGVGIFVLRHLASKHIQFPWRVFIGLALGLAMGVVAHFVYGTHNATLTETLQWIGLVGDGYVAFLQMIVMPLVIVSITGAILNLSGGQNVGKTTVSILTVLIGTTAIAALVGITVSLAFGLHAPTIEVGDVAARTASLESRSSAGSIHIAQQILSMLPANPFLDATGARNTSTIAMVIVSAFFAVAALQLGKKKPDSLNTIKTLVNALHDVVMRMVTLILRLTPYGVMALIVAMVSSSEWAQIAQLGIFVIASYVALITMFIIHLIIVLLNGLNPIQFAKKVWPVLVLGFATRSSAGVIAPNVKTQKEGLGVEEGTANMAAGLGTAIGQNGCAGIYPAMLVIMSMVSMGHPITPATIAYIVVVVAIASFGVAGVGGGATFAAIIVLSVLDLPVGIAGLLIAIEPLIDMGRTALNISDAMLAGLVTSKQQKTLNINAYNAKIAVDAETDAV